MPHIFINHIFLELTVVRQISVMPEHNTERRIHIKRLRFFFRVAAGRRISNVANPHFPSQANHILRPKHIAHQSVPFLNVDLVSIISRHTGSILPAVL